MTLFTHKRTGERENETKVNSGAKIYGAEMSENCPGERKIKKSQFKHKIKRQINIRGENGSGEKH